MATTILKDNGKCNFSDNIEEYLPFNNIANRKISELLDDKGNDLLIYPQSFGKCEDEMGDQCIFSLHADWEDGKCTKVTLETGNVVGFIGLNGKSISIHSRFSNDKEDFFLHYMLQKVLCVNVVNLSHGTANGPIFDFLLYLFPKFLKDALAQGVYKEYQRNEYNDADIRGTIDINRHLKTNLPFNGLIAYRTREFSYDNHVTELIRHTIDYIRKTPFGKNLLENDAETHASVAQIISATPSYSRQKRESIIRSNYRTIIHPYYLRYTPLQKLCLHILRHEKFMYGMRDDKIFGVLFDVSYLWEEYLASILTKQRFKHPNNKKRTGRIYLAKAGLLPRYPDFYREGGSIIDAKYKREISRDDFHQMVTYMYRLRGKNGMFVLPSEGKSENNIYELLGYGEECGSTLQVYSFHIPQSKDDYGQFVTDMEKCEMELKKQL